MIELSVKDAIAAHRDHKQRSNYPTRADSRFRNGLLFPLVSPRFQIKKGAKVFTIGSCFARNIEEKLQGFRLPTMGFSVPKSEWNGRPNGPLNEYTPGAMFQRIDSAISGKGFAERAIAKASDGVVDLLIPGAAVPVSMERAMERRSEMDGVYSHLKTSDVVIITLGLIQSWYDNQEDLYLNRMPTQSAISASPGRYTVRILDLEECYSLIGEAIQKMVSVGMSQIILTVSPVPMHTTFTDFDVVSANAVSKAQLRLCAHRLYSEFREVDYFPSYEIAISGGCDAMMIDNLHVKDEVVAQITDYMTSIYVPPDASNQSVP